MMASYFEFLRRVMGTLYGFEVRYYTRHLELSFMRTHMYCAVAIVHLSFMLHTAFLDARFPMLLYVSFNE